MRLLIPAVSLGAFVLVVIGAAIWTTDTLAPPPAPAGAWPAPAAVAPGAAPPAVVVVGATVPAAPTTPSTIPAPPASTSGAAPVEAPGRSRTIEEPLATWGPPPAPLVDPRRFTEAHWQGVEVIPNTPLVARALGIPPDAAGVIVDDVTLPADLQGIQGGDLITHVGQVPTPDLVAFIGATDRVRDRRRAEVDLLRSGGRQTVVLTALVSRLGTANGETPSMIPPGARMPHPYRGPCVNCHRIGTTGRIPVDQGDLISTAAPVIRVGAVRPHRDRGPCETCHRIVP